MTNELIELRDAWKEFVEYPSRRDFTTTIEMQFTDEWADRRKRCDMANAERVENALRAVFARLTAESGKE